MKEEYQKTYRDSRGNPMPLSDAQLDMMYKAKKMVEAMGVMKSSPQANKSDKAYLNDLGSREKSGPYMVESRDDRLIIKRRDFNQPPYRSYEYGGPTGELLDFTPESKTRTKAGASNAMGFGGWNPLSKTAFNGVADGDGDPVLAKWTNALKFYKAQVEKGYGDAILTPEKRVTVDRRTFGSVPKQKTADNTGRATPYNSPTVKDNAYQSNDLLRAGVMQYDIRVKDHVKALEAAIKDRTETKDLRTRQLYNALGINPEEAFNQANGLRKNSELNRNPASATVWGDPNIKTGMIITFLGVGKKHAGNYYVKRVTHTVDRSSGYITDMEFVRQGSNIQTPEAKSQAKGNQKVNNVVGPTKSQQHAKSLKTITNGGNKKG
jgi:hypothetical protein